MSNEKLHYEEMIAFCNGYLPDCDTKKHVIETLEKQIPKKPIETGEGRKVLLCPICSSYIGYIENRFVFGSENKYCWHCGQRIDWSEVEE